MFRWLRLKRTHARFLESCRNLKEGRGYWAQSSGLTRWFLETISPVPLMGLHEGGERLLSALEFLESSCRKCPLDEQVIRDYHRMIYKGDVESAGEYRSGRIAVIGSSFPRPLPEKVKTLMKQLNLKLEQEQKRLDDTAKVSEVQEAEVLASAVALHQRIAFIHPFGDANGRVARLAMNHFLRRYHLGYAILPPINESPGHWDALEEAHRGNLEPFIAFVKSCMVPV